MPAANWARPPTKQAIPMTAFGTVIPRALTLYMERTKVVLAKEKRPLCGYPNVSEVDQEMKGCSLTEGQGYR